jgi:hypothetical protein
VFRVYFEIPICMLASFFFLHKGGVAKDPEKASLTDLGGAQL